MISLPTLTILTMFPENNFMSLTEYDFLTHSDEVDEPITITIDRVLTEYDFLTHSDQSPKGDSLHRKS